MTHSTGVYFLANDAVLDWCHAFLASFRRFNPETRLILIPFDGRVAGVTRLRDRYRFEIYHDPHTEELDRMGADYYPGQQVPIINDTNAAAQTTRPT